MIEPAGHDDDWLDGFYDEDDEPCCDRCGKPIYDWSDYGCEACDTRVRRGEHLDTTDDDLT